MSHPFRSRPEGARRDYLTVVATVAASNDALSPGEAKRLGRLAQALDLPSAVVGEAVSAVALPPASLAELKRELRGSPLRHALVADALVLAQTDGLVDGDEKAELGGLRDDLGLSDGEFVALVTFVRGLLTGNPNEGLLTSVGIDPASLGARLLI